ncbi:MAG: LPS export ABC transporter periplasmic protein LptC [Ghiorsea sp.]|nr:LPS export ABC transporter periplasmic protein LptC [Ghiorsea sp.]
MLGQSPFTYLKWAFFMLAISSVLYTVVLLLSGKPGLQQAVDLAALKAGSTITNPDITEYDGDKLVWRLQADTAQEQGEVVNLVRPRLQMVLASGEIVPVLAKHGVYDEHQQKVTLTGDVVAHYQAWTLTSSHMNYIQNKGELIVPNHFVLVEEGIRVTGKDMRIYRDSGRLEVLQGVHMKIEESP